jgi:hypothetical protein
MRVIQAFTTLAPEAILGTKVHAIYTARDFGLRAKKNDRRERGGHF